MTIEDKISDLQDLQYKLRTAAELAKELGKPDMAGQMEVWLGELDEDENMLWDRKAAADIAAYKEQDDYYNGTR